MPSSWAKNRAGKTRTNASDFNAVGLSYVDVAIALAMYRRSVQEDVGEELTLQETTIFEHAEIGDWVKM